MKNGSKVHCLYEVEIFRRGRLVVVRITQFLVYDFYGTLVEHLPKSSRKKGVRLGVPYPNLNFFPMGMGISHDRKKISLGIPWEFQKAQNEPKYRIFIH